MDEVAFTGSEIKAKTLYELTNGKPITSLTVFASPTDEYYAAFLDRGRPFISYYSFQNGQLMERPLSRGDFWDLAYSAATCLDSQGILKGHHILHCFSANSLYDLVFRYAAILVGCVPVTVNWQADSNETIIHKAKITDSRLILYDDDFEERVEQIRPALLPALLFKARQIEHYTHDHKFKPVPLSYDDERLIVFTSGTTNKPKGVSLSHRSYLATRLTFEQYFAMSEKTGLDLLLVNPLHHTNSSALADWGMRRKGAVIHMVERYTTAFWEILVKTADRKRDLLVTSLVARHIDFLQSLADTSKLPVNLERIKNALNQTDILIGSSPVGPTTVERMLKFSNRLPHIRFGSTETCLQVMATPTKLSRAAILKVFAAGWSHHYEGREMIGYYIGREHYPFTRVRVVKAIDPENKDYLHRCALGEPGYMVTQGPNVMTGYLDNAKATAEVMRNGWYTGLRDIAFALRNETDGQLDYYWVSRDSALLIRGGANYSYEQIAAELNNVLVQHCGLEPTQFRLAVIALRYQSEHEDSCCVTIELDDELADRECEVRTQFMERANVMISKGANPDYLRFGKIPYSFKGDISYPQLKQDFLDYLQETLTRPS